eukprot:160754_1
MEELSKAIETHYAQTRPDKKSQLVKENIFNLIEKCCGLLHDSESDKTNPTRVLRRIPAAIIEVMRWDVFVFGSKTTGTSNSSPSSDIDIGISIDFKGTSFKLSESDREGLLFRLSQIISTHDPHNSLLIKDILHARYPIIKMYDIKSHEHLNVSISDDYCYERNELIKTCIAHHTSIWSKVVQSDECIQKLIVFVKHWSKMRGINGAYAGYINSFGFVVLVIKFVQWFEPTKLKEKQWNLGEILYEFYVFYASKFDWDRHCVSINHKFTKYIHITILYYRIFDKKVHPHYNLHIVDPVNINQNIARCVGAPQAKQIKFEFIRCVRIFEYNKNGKWLFFSLCDAPAAETEEECIFIDKDWVNRVYVKGTADFEFRGLDGENRYDGNPLNYYGNARWGAPPDTHEYHSGDEEQGSVTYNASIYNGSMAPSLSGGHITFAINEMNQVEIYGESHDKPHEMQIMKWRRAIHKFSFEYHKDNKKKYDEKNAKHPSKYINRKCKKCKGSGKCQKKSKTCTNCINGSGVYRTSHSLIHTKCNGRGCKRCNKSGRYPLRDILCNQCKGETMEVLHKENERNQRHEQCMNGYRLPQLIPFVPKRENKKLSVHSIPSYILSHSGMYNMKRLYHATNRERADGIIETGVMFRDGNGKGEGIIFTDNGRYAEMKARENSKGYVVIADVFIGKCKDEYYVDNEMTFSKLHAMGYDSIRAHLDDEIDYVVYNWDQVWVHVVLPYEQVNFNMLR